MSLKTVKLWLCEVSVGSRQLCVSKHAGSIRRHHTAPASLVILRKTYRASLQASCRLEGGGISICNNKCYVEDLICVIIDYAGIKIA